jgi:hypothetical protein
MCRQILVKPTNTHIRFQRFSSCWLRTDRLGESNRRICANFGFHLACEGGGRQLYGVTVVFIIAGYSQETQSKRQNCHQLFVFVSLETCFLQTSCRSFTFCLIKIQSCRLAYAVGSTVYSPLCSLGELHTNNTFWEFMSLPACLISEIIQWIPMKFRIRIYT